MGSKAADVARRYGAPVEKMPMKHGIFDDATISIIAAETIAEIARLSGLPCDAGRFRPNLLLRATRAVPFEEDARVGGVLTFGGGAEAPAVAVTAHDVRCAMVNIDPDSRALTPDVLKAMVRANRNNAGVYGAVTRAGRLAVGQAVMLQRSLTTVPAGSA